MDRIYHRGWTKSKTIPAILLASLIFVLPAFAVTINYTYDSLNRLTGVNHGNGIYIEYSYDAAGNRLVRNAVIDTTPPTGSVVINNNASHSNDTSVNLLLTCNDTESGCEKMQISNDNINWSNEEPVSTGKAWTLSAENGTKMVYARFKDEANWSETFSSEIVLDTLPPDTSITVMPPSIANSAAASFSVTSNEADSSFQCRMDEGDYGNCSSPADYSGLEDGVHTFYATATDPAGNTDATPASYSWVIDTAPPAFVSVSPETGDFINMAAVGYELGEDVHAGSASFVRAGGTDDPSSPHTYSFIVPDMKAGTHSIHPGLSLVDGTTYTISFAASDEAGNTSLISNAGIIYDSVSTLVRINHPPSNGVTDDSKVGFTLMGSINSGDIVFTRTGGAVDTESPYIYSLAPGELSAGNHAFDTGLPLMEGSIYKLTFINVMDQVGNHTSDTGKSNIRFDSSSVALSETSPASNSIVVEHVIAGYTLSRTALSGRITFTRTGGGADPDSPHVYTMTPSDVTSGAHTIDTGLSLVSGTFYTISFEAVDLSGRPATSISHGMILYKNYQRLEEGHGSIVYAGAWTTVNDNSASGDSLKIATQKWAKASFTFTGTAIRWIAAKSSIMGSARIHLDGIDEGLVSLTGNPAAYQQVVFERTGLPYGEHTIEIELEAINQKNKRAKRNYINIDAFEYLE